MIVVEGGENMVLLRLLVAKKIAPTVTRRKDIGQNDSSSNIFSAE